MGSLRAGITGQEAELRDGQSVNWGEDIGGGVRRCKSCGDWLDVPKKMVIAADYFGEKERFRYLYSPCSHCGARVDELNNLPLLIRDEDNADL